MFQNIQSGLFECLVVLKGSAFSVCLLLQITEKIIRLMWANVEFPISNYSSQILFTRNYKQRNFQQIKLSVHFGRIIGASNEPFTN